jgi:hypothetical protein
MAPTRSVLLFAGVAVACSRQNAVPPTAQDASSAPIAADSGAPARPATRAPAPSAAPRVLGDAERAKYRAYLAAMSRGRTATRAKHYAEAVDDFSAALEAKPDDAQGLTERGYARLLHGDYPSALEDFDQAHSLTKDPKLLAQVWFNRGLIDEKLGHDDAALADFVTSDHLSPTKAAKAKIGGRRTCPIEVARDGDLSAEPVIPPSMSKSEWQKVLADLTARSAEGVAVSGATYKLPAVVAVERMDGEWVDEVFVVGEHAGRVRAVQVGSGMRGRCSGHASFTLDEVDGDLVYVSGEELTLGGEVYMCMPDDGDPLPCDQVKGDTSRMPMLSGCGDDTPTLRNAIVDLRAGKIVLSLERPKPSDDNDVIAIVPDPSGYRVSGLDCDAVVTIAAPQKAVAHEGGGADR